MPSIPLVLLLGSVLVTDAVVVPLDALAPPDPPPDAPPVTVLVDSMEAAIVPGEESALDLVWTLRALEPTWVDLAVTGSALALSDATLDGLAVALPPDADGHRHVTAHLTGHHTLRARGTLLSPQRSFDLAVLPAARMHAEIVAGDWQVEVEGAAPRGDSGFDLIGADRLTVSWSPAAPAAVREVVVDAESAAAVLVDAGGLEGKAVLRYRVRHGTVEQVSFQLPGAHADLEVGGSLVARHFVEGDRVVIVLDEPARGVFEITVSYRAPPDDEAVVVPLPTPQGATGGWLTVLRGDDSFVALEPGQGVAPSASGQLPSWARGLAPGTTVATYRLTGRRPSLQAQVLLYEPAEEPPTLVDEARYEVAYASHGGVLLRALYQVRNDRNQYLRVGLPEGFSLIGVRVAGEVVRPVTDGGDVLSVPLEKSVETLHGLVSFPVEVLLWGEQTSWDRRGLRTLATPTVDAPVAYARWEVVMPPDRTAREAHGIPRMVDDWSSRSGGLAYGRAHGEQLDDDLSTPAPVAARAPRRQRVRGKSTAATSSTRHAKPAAWPAVAAPEPEPSAPPMDDWVADELSQDAWNQAYRAYQDNRFHDAQGYLDKSLELNPDNRAASALLGNVSLLLGEEEDEEDRGDEVMERRVREMARAKTASIEVQQEKKKRKAEASLRAGDLEAARAEYQQLAEITEQLAVVEQEESFDNRALLREVERQISDLEQRVADGKGDVMLVPDVISAPAGATASSTRAYEYAFESIEIEGSLEVPEDHWKATVEFEAYEDEDGRPDLGILAGLDGASVISGEVAVTEELQPGAATIVLTDADADEPAESSGRGGWISAGQRASGRDTARGPSADRNDLSGKDAVDLAQNTERTRTPLADIPVEVTAAQLTLRVPHAGQVLRFEQRLVPENTPLTLEVSYRTKPGRNR